MTRPSLRRLVGALPPALLLAGCVGGPDATEGDDARGPVRDDPRCKFGAVQSLGAAVNTPRFEGSPTVSADQRTLFFTSNRAGRHEDLYASTRPHPQDPWGEAVNLGEAVNHPAAHDNALRLSHDGNVLFFSSNRAGGFGSSDLYVTRRRSASHAWEPPENLGPLVNTEAVEGFPTPSSDGTTLYFNRSTTFDSADSDIWVATRPHEDAPWGAPERLPEPVRGPGADLAPAISVDGLTLYFASDRPGNIGLIDVWVARRLSEGAPWGVPSNLGPEVNTPHSVTMAPFVSADGRNIYFMSTRPGGLGGPDCGFFDCFDLYVATWACSP